MPVVVQLLVQADARHAASHELVLRILALDGAEHIGHIQLLLNTEGLAHTRGTRNDQPTDATFLCAPVDDLVEHRERGLDACHRLVFSLTGDEHLFVVAGDDKPLASHAVVDDNVLSECFSIFAQHLEVPGETLNTLVVWRGRNRFRIEHSDETRCRVVRLHHLEGPFDGLAAIEALGNLDLNAHLSFLLKVLKALCINYTVPLVYKDLAFWSSTQLEV